MDAAAVSDAGRRSITAMRAVRTWYATMCLYMRAVSVQRTVLSVDWMGRG